tara:strand:- start:56 stop:340 length:285 start_codon:yes stop_codon:yes gene_type:complete
MIDTDKYEGHLMDKAVEHNTQVWCWHTWMTSHTETIEDYNATAALLNDAPLLLAEVQRLREGIVNALIPTDTNPIIHPLVKLSDLRDALKEMIK